ncbi:heme ABC exporter ATP-binding protein CcmA [Effusibacillus lacus]|uniref:Heme ABC exporter, ATP-binding protein CcmA n=1 Tax=Effusibacillus lacus TaxID=1348429 RepID=A0A292YN69_9BACL|nr:heme ABC exporter ATP-binding protein CcmA [Effusibacillus lacus]TCS76110.1 heme exporter protein A [Effusibacillus lacus]GAX91378.1 heme ABC exporter, ATP-binding protein CcmA [Effusibacillus lacus]
MTPIISARQLCKSAGEKMILRGIDINIRAGESVAVLGPNGAGKSTLLKILSTLVKPTEGELLIQGKRVADDGAAIKRMIGYLPHNSLLYDHLTAAQNLAFYGKMYRVPQLRERIEELLRKVGLYHFRDEPVRLFSRGMIQRLSIARAILHRPQILLLDEPHTGLDREACDLLNRLIDSLKAENGTIIMVTHDFEHALEVCERILIVRNGKLADDLSTGQLEQEELFTLYRKQVAG